MKVMVRLFQLSLLFLLLLSCTDEKAVNAAFFQGQTTWMRFEGAGLVPINGFESEPALAWKPRFRAQYVTDMALVPGDSSAVALAVSSLGLLVLSDSDGTLKPQTLTSALDLSLYRTGRLFSFDGKVFFHVYREPPVQGQLPAVSLAWWKPGQGKVAFYPVPSQVADQAKQAVNLRFQGGSVDFLWKNGVPGGWKWASTRMNLADGKETSLTLVPWDREPRGEAPEVMNSVKEKLSSRLGSDLSDRMELTMGDGSSRTAAWEGKTGPLVTAGAWNSTTSILLAENGVVAVKEGEEPRIFRLPDLGAAGKYTRVAALKYGFLVSWELSWRGYTGPSGLVYIPYALLKS